MTNECEPFLTYEVRNALLDHMNEAGDEECCGVITLSEGRYAYQRCKNEAKSPTERFAFSKADRNRIVRNKAIVAYAHSHPNGPSYPSQLDQETQRKVCKPAVIVCRDPKHGQVAVFSHGDHLLDAPLDGRVFRHAVFDCYESIRSCVWQFEGRKMDPYPREAEWWEASVQNDPKHKDMVNLYDRFTEQGYREFTPRLKPDDAGLEVQIGDIILMKLGTTVINHGAYYLGNNEVHHHRLGRRSGSTPIGYVLDKQYDSRWIRHESKFA